MFDYRTTLDMTDDQLLDAANLMSRQGGRFAAAIADAFFVADRHNRHRLIAAFGDLFAKFHAALETRL